MARLRMLSAGAMFAAVAGCYSWQLGSDPGGADGGREASASHTDGNQGSDGQAPHDASSPEHDGSHPIDSGHPIDSMSTSHPDAGSCTSLFSAAMAAFTRAQMCAEPSTACTTEVKDPCGCTAFLEQSNSGASQAYMSALAALGAASCVEASCKTCVPYTGTEGVCLSGLTLDGSVAIACSP